jgi:hypothetical protein
MSEKPISQLRRRMIEDMTVRNFVEKTSHNRPLPPQQSALLFDHPLAIRRAGRS